MTNISLIIAEKIIKVITAYLLGKKTLMTATDIASLCSAFFKGKDPVSELSMKNSLEKAQLILQKGIDEILSKGALTEQQHDYLMGCINDSINRTDLSSDHLVQMYNNPNKLYNEFVANCAELKTLNQIEEDYAKRCFHFVSLK